MDDQDAFSAVLPKRRHFAGKRHAQAIESDNSNTRHRSGRSDRGTKIVSRSEASINDAIKLWLYARNGDVF